VPFILLLKPMIAVGLFLTKMLVAVGFVATEGVQPPEQTSSLESPVVHVELGPEDDVLRHMEVELPNGEFYALVDYEAHTVAPRFTSGRPLHGRSAARGSGGAPIVARLESESGHEMLCELSLASDSASGAGSCRTDGGDEYDVVF
jgi:hypothetical protein